MEYIHLFDAESQHQQFVAYTGDTYTEPYVSLTLDDDEVHYNRKPYMTVTYNVTGDSENVQLYFYNNPDQVLGSSMVLGETPYYTPTILGSDSFDTAVIGNTEIPIANLDSNGGMTALTSGEHVVKYVLKDPTKIGMGAFNECSAITKVEIPDSVTGIGDGAFYGCTSLSSVTIPDSVTGIGNGAFYGCTSLSSVTIPDSVTGIGGRVFCGCASLSSITIPSSVVNVGLDAFEGCSSITSATINSVSVGTFLRDCPLETVVMGDNVKTIENYAFNSMTTIRTVEIGSGITEIMDNPFYSENSVMESITIKAVTPPPIGYICFDGTNNCPIYVPSASVDTYKAASGWSTYASRIQAIQE